MWKILLDRSFALFKMEIVSCYCILKHLLSSHAEFLCLSLFAADRLIHVP